MGVADVQAVADLYRSSKYLADRDHSLDSLELLRWAERSLAVAIRQGQARGEILRPRQRADRHPNAVAVTHFAPYDLLAGTGHSPGLYSFADGITDDEFAAAIARCRDEANLSRRNVARRLGRPRTTEPIRKNGRVYRQEGDYHYGKRHEDPIRAVERLVWTLDAAADIADGLDAVNAKPAQATEWARTLRRSLRRLSLLAKTLEANGKETNP